MAPSSVLINLLEQLKKHSENILFTRLLVYYIKKDITQEQSDGERV